MDVFGMGRGKHQCPELETVFIKKTSRRRCANPSHACVETDTATVVAWVADDDVGIFLAPTVVATWLAATLRLSIRCCTHGYLVRRMIESVR